MSFSWEEARAELARRRQVAQEMGGAEAIARQRAAGRKTVRERIEMLLDPGSFTEIGTLATFTEMDADGKPLPSTASSFICGLAKVDGRPIAFGAEDFTVGAGFPTLAYLDRTKGEVGGFIEDLAHEYRLPLLMALEGVGGGVAIQQAKGHAVLVNSVPWRRSFQLMGEVPVLAAVVGVAAGGVAARAAMTHFSVMTRHTAAVFAGGPPMIRRALGYSIDKFDLGGAEIQAKLSGTIDNIAEDEEDAFRQLRTVLSYLPQNVWEMPPKVESDDPVDRACEEILRIMPTNRRRIYDVRAIIEVVFDRGSFFEIGRDWGKAVVLGLSRIGGRSVGVVASNPGHIGGALDGPAAEKQVRFMEFCDTFHIPIVYFVDVPGFMIGADAERGGVVRKGTRAMQAMAELQVPVITIHTRKAYGMAVSTSSAPEALGLRLAWPTAEGGDMPAEGAVEAAFRRQIAAAPDPDAYRRRIEEGLIAEASPWRIAEAFGVEEIIDPAETRRYIARFLEASEGAIRSQLGIRWRMGPRI